MASPPDTGEKELLISVSTGNEKAFRELFDQYRDKVYNFSMHLTRSEILSEEIVQEVFMKIWINRSNLTQIAFFASYVRMAARNTAIDFFRKLAREKLALEGFSDRKKNATISEEDTILEREYAKILKEIVHGLPPRQQEVYILSRQQGLKNEEIAGQLGISIYTVKEHLKIAMHTILKQLETRIDLIIATAIAIYF